MKINANPLDTSIVSADIQDPPTLPASESVELNTPLERLSQKAIAGDEVVGLLQKYGLLTQLQQELIIDAELESIECTPEETFSAYKAFYHHQQINSDEDRARWLAHNNFELSQLEELVMRTIKLDRFKKLTFNRKVDTYFLQRKSQLDRAIYRLLRVRDFHLGQELFFRIQDGEATFAELSQQHSEAQEAPNGGLVGPQELSMPHPTLAQKIRSLKEGQLADPVQLNEWFVIIQLEKHLPAQLDDSMRARLIDELFNQWIQEKLNQLAVDTK